MKKSYTVTLATVAIIKGRIEIEADNVDQAIAEAVRRADEADWPVDADSNTLHPNPGYAFADCVRRDDVGDYFMSFGYGMTPENATRLGESILRDARDLFRAAGAVRTVERIRLAITSANGAVRNACGKAAREEAKARA